MALNFNGRYRQRETCQISQLLQTDVPPMSPVLIKHKTYAISRWCLLAFFSWHPDDYDCKVNLSNAPGVCTRMCATFIESQVGHFSITSSHTRQDVSWASCARAFPAGGAAKIVAHERECSRTPTAESRPWKVTVYINITVRFFPPRWRKRIVEGFAGNINAGAFYGAVNFLGDCAASRRRRRRVHQDNEN